MVVKNPLQVLLLQLPRS